VPIRDLGRALKCFHDEVEIYPIWLCPFKLPSNPGMLKTESGEEEMYVISGYKHCCAPKSVICDCKVCFNLQHTFGTVNYTSTRVNHALVGSIYYT